MSVIIYKAKNQPIELNHKIYKNKTVTYTNDHKGHESEIRRWKEDGNLWEEHLYLDKYSETYMFYKNGKLHDYSIDEPAYYYCENKYGYYVTKHYNNGLLHNLSGPAVIYDDEGADVYKRECWINGEKW
jgi:hypothetical protein